MKSDNSYIKRHRGSSPPFQEAEQYVFEWAREFKPEGQISKNTLEFKTPDQNGNELKTSVGQRIDFHGNKNMQTEKKSLDETADEQDRND